MIGTAADMIGRLDLPAEEKVRLVNNIPVAHAVSYLVGTGFVVWFLSSLAPRLLRVDLKAEARKLEQEIAGGAEEQPGVRSAYPEWDRRAHRVAEDEPGDPALRLLRRGHRDDGAARIQGEAGSRLPLLGYTVPYAVGNILLTAWGSVIAALTR